MILTQLKLLQKGFWVLSSNFQNSASWGSKTFAYPKIIRTLARPLLKYDVRTFSAASTTLGLLGLSLGIAADEASGSEIKDRF